jgi:hypothetical protein
VEERSVSSSHVMTSNDTHSNNVAPSTNTRTGNSRNYMQLQIDPSILEQELADLRGDRDGVPPVVLPPPVANVALRFQSSLFSKDGGNTLKQEASLNTDNTPVVMFDYELAREWSIQLKQSMRFAEQSRQQEDMRPMPYELIPEAWTRLRPAELISSLDQDNLARDTSSRKDNDLSCDEKNQMDKQGYTSEEQFNSDNNKEFGTLKDDDDEDRVISSSITSSWSVCRIRSTFDAIWNGHNNNNTARFLCSTRAFDTNTNIIIELLYKGTNLHIACGAKFGCDYLLYDGPRNERHAFAGLRVLTIPNPKSISDDKEFSSEDRSSQQNFPNLSPYELAGYVRCLNTAGKLALLATVVSTTISIEGGKNKMIHRVAIIDLALEKMIETTVNRPKKTLEQRLQLLSKT